jgi:hypothetical protein
MAMPTTLIEEIAAIIGNQWTRSSTCVSESAVIARLPV